MRKFVVLATAVLLSALVITGCGNNGAQDEENYSIGIVQLVEHPALDASREGFIAGLAEEGFIEEENITIDYSSAQADQAVALTISQGFVNDSVDLILAIATPTAISAANATQGTDIPVLFTAVTDPVAAELVNDWDTPGVNVTGTSDLNPVEDQIKLIQKIVPDAETIGIIYNAGEANSVVQAEMVREITADLGLGLEEATVTNTSEVAQATQSLVGKIDAIYVFTDNTVVEALPSVLQIAEEQKIPVLAGESDSVKTGAIATVGINYYDLGFKTGQMAAEILNGEDPSAMAVVKGMDLGITYSVNLEAAERMGVEIPDDIMAEADVVSEEE